MDWSGGSGERLEKARSCAAKAGNSFLDFRPSSEILPLLYSLTFINETSLTSQSPKVLSLPPDLERVCPSGRLLIASRLVFAGKSTNLTQ